MLNQKKTASDEELTTPIGLARYAFEYLNAAILVNDQANDKYPGNQISPTPAYFLAFHGIELTLKSFLRSKGLTLIQLGNKKLGHSLNACYLEAIKLGLEDIFKTNPKDATAIEMLEGLNEKQGLRYIRTGSKNFPLWSIVESFAVRLHQAVASDIGHETFGTSYPDYK